MLAEYFSSTPQIRPKRNLEDLVGVGIFVINAFSFAHPAVHPAKDPSDGNHEEAGRKCVEIGAGKSK